MSVNLLMTFYTCGDCGATYGYPAKYDHDDCPFYLKREDAYKASRISELWADIEKRDNSIRGLRGTITRIKKGTVS